MNRVANDIIWRAWKKQSVASFSAEILVTNMWFIWSVTAGIQTAKMLEAYQDKPKKLINKPKWY